MKKLRMLLAFPSAVLPFWAQAVKCMQSGEGKLLLVLTSFAQSSSLYTLNQQHSRDVWSHG